MKKSGAMESATDLLAGIYNRDLIIGDLKQALRPLKSGDDWGFVKAILVNSEHPDGARLAKLITAWNARADFAFSGKHIEGLMK